MGSGKEAGWCLLWQSRTKRDRDGTRTHNPLIRSQMRYPLRHAVVKHVERPNPKHKQHSPLLQTQPLPSTPTNQHTHTTNTHTTTNNTTHNTCTTQQTNYKTTPDNTQTTHHHRPPTHLHTPQTHHLLTKPTLETPHNVINIQQSTAIIIRASRQRHSLARSQMQNRSSRCQSSVLESITLLAATRSLPRTAM